jgi:hypothetical protein
VRGAFIAITLTIASCGSGMPDVLQAPVAASVVVIPALEDEVVGTVPSTATKASTTATPRKENASNAGPR